MDPLRRKTFFCFVLLLCLFYPLYGAETELQTFSLFHPLSLYAEPESGSPLIAVAAEGQKISFHSREKGWIKISFSGETTAWVASCFLKNGVYTEDVIFRMGPTSAAAALTVKSSFAGKTPDFPENNTGAYWKKVRLKADFIGYVSQKDLENSLKKIENTHKIKSFSIISTAVGRLLPLEKPYLHATHKLIYKVNDAEYLVAYVIPDKVNLKLWENWMIYISGESLWNQGVFTPFMKGANIFPAYR